MKILHFADVHLGMTNFGGIDFNTGLHGRVLEYLDAMDIIVDVAKSEKPDLIIFAGDAFKTRSPSTTLIANFGKKLQLLAEVADVVMVVGNHDRLRSGKGVTHSVELFQDFSSKHAIIVERNVVGVHIGCAYIITLPWFYGVDVDAVGDMIDYALDAAPIDVPVILIGHCDVEGSVYHDGYSLSIGTGGSVYPLSMFCDAGAYDYVALGHVHRHQCLCDTPPVVYAGSLERVTWGERKGAKGFVLADVDVGSASWEFVDIQARSMVPLEVKYTDIRGLANSDIDNAIVRIAVTADYKHSLGAVHRLVRRVLHRKNCYIDSIEIIRPRDPEVRSRSTLDVSGMSPLEVVGEYLDNVYSADQERADLLYDYAADLIDRAD